MLDFPIVRCPKCSTEAEMDSRVLTAQSNQNIIYRCPSCDFIKKNIETNKG